MQALLWIEATHLAGEDFDKDLFLPNIDFATYVREVQF